MARTKQCNMCGNDITRGDSSNFSMNHTYGYFSDYDNSSMELDLCSECLDKLTKYLIDNCKISPVID